MFFWKFFVALMVFSLLIFGGAPVAGQAPIRVLIDGELLQMDVPPIIEEGRTLVPMRAIFERMGIPVKWEDKIRTVVAYALIGEIRLPIDSVNVTVGGVGYVLDVPARIVNGRTLVPLRFVSEMLGADVAWHGEMRLIQIVSGARHIGGGADTQDPYPFRSAEQIRQDAEDLLAYMASVGYRVILRPVAGGSVAVFDANGFGAHDGLMTAVEKTVAEFNRLIGIRQPLLVIAMRHLDPLLEAGAFMVRRIVGTDSTPETQRVLWEIASGQAGVYGVSVFKEQQQGEHPGYIKYVGCSTSKTLGHELTHAKQFEAQRTARGGSGEGFIPAPAWLKDGVAGLVGDAVSFQVGCSREKIWETAVASTQRGQTPLEGYVNMVMKDRGYDTAYVAVSYLHSLWLQGKEGRETLDFSWVEEYWGLIGIRISPEEAFRRVFRMSLEEFYQLFEQYQRDGYPQVLQL